jgi:chloride channel protein, CIC family
VSRLTAALLRHPRFRRYIALVREDLVATHARNLREWLLAAPVLGVLTGGLITAIVEAILRTGWPVVLTFDLAHPLAIVPILGGGFLVAGLLMQRFTPDPDEHSTEEVVRAYRSACLLVAAPTGRQ